MPKSARIDVAGYWYHTIARGQRKNPLFLCTADRRRYLELLDRALLRHGARLGAYCLMTNHVHLLVYRGCHPLGNTFNAAHGAYARYFNKRHKLAGYLFQGRFKTKIVLSDSYLDSLLNYIHMNPVKAGMCKSPHGYVWSSDRFYREHGIKTYGSLVRLPGYEGKAGQREYAGLMQDESKYPESKEFHIGTEEEIKMAGTRPISLPWQMDNPCLETVAERASGMAMDANITMTNLRSPLRNRNISRIRSKIMAALYEEGFSPSAIAYEFCRTPAAVIRAAERNAKSQ